MELFSAEFFSALLAIIIIDLVLAGDNAIVIGLAARNLPRDHQRQVIVWGTVGAVVVRAIATLAIVWLLKIPGLLLVGGLLLIWIAYKLLTEDKNHDHMKAHDTRWEAIRTIIIADAVMGLDNVLAVAGSAHGSFLLVILGLLISVPIMVWGSTFILKWMERFPIIIYIGAGVIALTAAKMIADEPLLKTFFTNTPPLKYVLMLVVVGGVLLAGRAKNRRRDISCQQS
ncbi:TerC family protein [Desulforamulus putei]|uniref:Integral membrane protein, YjbE family n=1 Tax=Desulforamulus putei DSM 12395 TaxID=1121429 RepID=A0A1M4XM50_9FIRM|nr:TerC family protein [Desulforamulus putei]SHE94644.1 integral membrane protein, YjbE family [Desulforamulus putei DSM 12395]